MVAKNPADGKPGDSSPVTLTNTSLLGNPQPRQHRGGIENAASNFSSNSVF